MQCWPPLAPFLPKWEKLMWKKEVLRLVPLFSWFFFYMLFSTNAFILRKILLQNWNWRYCREHSQKLHTNEKLHAKGTLMVWKLFQTGWFLISQGILYHHLFIETFPSVGYSDVFLSFGNCIIQRSPILAINHVDICTITNQNFNNFEIFPKDSSVL